MSAGFRARPLWAAGAALALCVWRLRALGDPRLRLAAWYGWFAAAFACYLLALWAIRRAEQQASSSSRLGVLWIIGVAIAARALLLPTTPALSDDIYRYRWDGRVQQAGIDPYAYPPSDPRLAFLRDAAYTKINFPQLRTIYPPLTELAFRAGQAAGGTLMAHKRIMVLAEAITVVCLLLVLRMRQHSLLWIAAYAWHPLAILEVAGSGHNDALGIAMLWLGVAAWEARRWAGAAVAFSAACWAKFASVLLVPWWWRRGDRRWLAAFAALAAAPFLAHPATVHALVESLSAMAGRVESNSSLFALASFALGPTGARLAAIAGGAAWLWWWSARARDVIQYLLGALAGVALLSPALHPWYLVWLVPCFCVQRPRALVLLTGTVVFAYAVWPGRLASGAWHLPAWARALEYAPVMALGALECVRPSSSLLGMKPQPSAAS